MDNLIEICSKFILAYLSYNFFLMTYITTGFIVVKYRIEDRC